MRFTKFIKEGKKSHFVYQRNVPNSQTIVHRGTEQSSKEWIQKNAHHFLHKGKDFDIYKKPKGRGIRLRDRLDFRHIHKD